MNHPPEVRPASQPLPSTAPSSLAPIRLPAPAEAPGLSVFAALSERRTTRDSSTQPLSRQVLANVLWASCGVNRSGGLMGGSGRTAASASNSQEIDLFVALPEGAFLYDAANHVLTPVSSEDLRPLALTPLQSGVKATAPVQLIYVADLHRLTHTRGFDEPTLHDPEGQKSYYFVDTGLIAGNVFLYAASQGLAAWFHNCDRIRLADRLHLKADQRVLFAQSVGYPQKA